MYTKPRTESQSPNVGAESPSGPDHNYDPREWNDFENDAPILREFFESLVDYPDLWFDGRVASGPGAHQYVLSSEQEAVAYISSNTLEEGVEFGPSTLELVRLATGDGNYDTEVVDPASGVVDERSIGVHRGGASVELPAFMNNLVAHLY